MHGTGKVNGEEIILKSDNETTPDSSVLLNVKLTLHKYCRKDIWSHYINIVEKTYGKSRVILLVTVTFLVLRKL